MNISQLKLNKQNMTLKGKTCKSPGGYTYRSARSGRVGGELRYKGRLLTSKSNRRAVDKFVHKYMCAITSDEEKCRIKHQVCKMILERNHQKLKNSQDLISKYCMLFDDHQKLSDDWIKMWNIANSYDFNNVMKH